MNNGIEEKKAVESGGAPEAVGPYSQAIQVGNLMFISGQLPIDPATGIIAAGQISIQAHRP